MLLPELGIKGLTLENGRYFVIRREGQQVQRYPLTREAEGIEALCAAAASLKGMDGPPVYIADLLRRFIRDGLPEQVKSKALTQITADEYQRIYEAPVIGMIALFGKMRVGDLGSDDIAVHLEEGRKAGRGTMANRERSALSSAIEWGRRQKGWQRSWGMQTNPCRGVRRNYEAPSKVYVAPEQLQDAQERGSEALAILLDGANLSGIRFTDLALLERAMLITLVVGDQVKNFIRWNESKTDKANLMEILPKFMEVIQRAIAYGDATATKITKRLPIARPLPTRVFVNTRGKPWTQAAMSSAMAYAEATFAFRQVRAKAETDSSNRDDSVLGHKGQMRERYRRLRKLRSVA